MKLKKFMCMAVTASITMTSAAMLQMPIAFATAVTGNDNYSEDFRGYGTQNYQPTLLGLKDYGWYMADHTQLYTNVAAVAPYSTYSYKLAKIQSDYLYITSAGEAKGSANATYGYGKTFPGVAANGAAKGVWEISFDFYPNGTEFAFTLNTADGSAASATDAQHNIISQYGNYFYLGYRNYQTLYNGGANSSNIPQGTLPAAQIGGKTWYSVKTILNCDARYYSVELYNRSTGKLIARRSPISFAGNETIGFLKFSALGMTNVSNIGIDNVSIKKTAIETTIYEDNFDSYTTAPLASAGTSVGGTTEDLAGSSYFEGYTPWRALLSAGNYYAFETGPDGSNAVRLGSTSTNATGSSGLVYMPVKDKLVTPATQAVRGKLTLYFTVKPDTIADAGYQVYFTPEYNNTGAKAFEIVKNNDTNKIYIVKDSGYQEIDDSKWYDVELTFDVISRTVETKAREHGTSAILSFSTAIPSLTAVKGLLFNAIGETSVVLDDVKIRYTANTGVYAAISSVKATNNGNTAAATLQDFIDGNNIEIFVDWYNYTEEDKNIAVVFSYFDADGHFLGYQHRQINGALQAGKAGSGTRITIAATPADLHGISGNAEGVPAKVAVCLWDGLGNNEITPYCNAEPFEAAAE